MMPEWMIEIAKRVDSQYFLFSMVVNWMMLSVIYFMYKLLCKKDIAIDKIEAALKDVCVVLEGQSQLLSVMLGKLKKP